MAATFNYYQCISNISELNILEGDIYYFTNVDNHWHKINNNHILPTYINPENNPYFKYITKTYKYDIGSIIKYKNSYFYNRKNGPEYKGTIKEIYPNTIKVLRENTKDTIDIIYHHDVKCILDIYWFISSSGKICSTCTGKNEDADKFRNLTKNMFATKDDAIKTLNRIIKDRVQYTTIPVDTVTIPVDIP